MRLPPTLRRLTLAFHVICSVGWIGAVAVLNIYKPRGMTGFGQRARSGRPGPAIKSSKI